MPSQELCSIAILKTVLRWAEKGEMMRQVFFLVCLFSFVLIALGQSGSVVRGRVTVEQHGLKDNEVRLNRHGSRDIAFSTNTDEHGNYRFENVPPGKYLLQVTNYLPNVNFVDTPEIIVEAGVTKTLDLEMIVKADDLGTVTISADTVQPIEQVSKTVDVIDGQEMRDRADFSLVESLRTIPGFRVQQLGGFGRTANIKIRGLRNQDTALLVDGIRFRDASSITGDATPFISDFTLTNISRIEVMRGSGSSLYGTNAIGGAIDFRTPGAASGTHGQISGALGALGLGRFRGNISHGAEDGRFGIVAGYSRTVYSKGIDGDDDARNHNLQLRADARPAAQTSISGKIFLSDAKVRLNVNPDSTGPLPLSNAVVIDARNGVNFIPDANDPDSIQRSRFYSVQVRAEHAVNNKIVLGGYYQGLKTRRLNADGPLGPGFQSPTTSVFEGSIHTANANVAWTPNDLHRLSGGYEFESERFFNEGRTPSGIGDFSTHVGQQSHSAYLQDLVSLVNGRLQLAGSVRFQRFSLGQPDFSLANAPYSGLKLSDPPSAFTLDAAAAYSFRSSGTKLRAHIGNGYRVPSLYERFGTFFSTFGTPQFIALGDPLLRPEKTIAFDAGVEQKLSGERASLSATYFYTRLNDIIGFGNIVPNIGSTPRPFGGYENQKGGIARGGEFSSRIRPSATTEIFASYTYTNSDQRTPQVSGSPVIRSLGIPEHQFTLVATQRFERFWINFDLLATSNYLAPIFSGTTFTSYVYRFGGNRRADLTAGYTFRLKHNSRSLRLFGTIENIFDHQYFENGFRTPGLNARIGLSIAF
jgi:vitamin B12 transporter